MISVTKTIFKVILKVRNGANVNCGKVFGAQVLFAGGSETLQSSHTGDQTRNWRSSLFWKETGQQIIVIQISNVTLIINQAAGYQNCNILFKLSGGQIL